MNIESIKKLRDNIIFRNIIYAIGVFVLLLILVFYFLRIYTHHGEAISVPDIRGMNLQEVNEFLKKHLKYEVTDSIFVIEKNKGTVIEQNPAPGYKVKLGRTIFLTMNAYYPEKITMPNVVGVSLRQASAFIETKGLRVGKLIYVPDIAINNVLEQKFDGRNIAPGDSIYKGSYIDLVLGQGLSYQKTSVPDLINLTIEEAKKRISVSFLNLSSPVTDNSVIDLEDSLSARIWKQRPSAQEHIKLPLGSYIDIWITTDSVKLHRADSTKYIHEKTFERDEYEDEENW